MVQLRDLVAGPTSISRPPPAPMRTHGQQCYALCKRWSPATFPISPASLTPAFFPSKSHPAVSAPLQWGKYGIGLQRCVPSPNVPTLAAAWCRYRSPSAFREAARLFGTPSGLASPPTPAALPCRWTGKTPLTPCAGTTCWARQHSAAPLCCPWLLGPTDGTATSSSTSLPGQWSAHRVGCGRATLLDRSSLPSPRGLLAAGTPIGTPSFQTANAESCATRACNLIDKLLELRLGDQDRWLVLHGSLQKGVAHLPRGCTREHIGPAVVRAESKAVDCAFAIMAQARIDGPPMDQLTLPMCPGGLGLAHTCPEEGDAAYLSAVATTQLAMRHGLAEFRPFDGLSGAQLCPQ
jgi:hypothetical protein